MNRFRELDGLRAVAICLVLGVHYEGFAKLGGLEFGWVGVDIFFVLSGYLITTILLGMRNRPTPYKTFYLRRAARILPPYLAVSLVIVVLGVASRHFAFAKPSSLLTQALFLQAFRTRSAVFVADVAQHLRWYALHLASLRPSSHSLPKGYVGVPLALISAPATYWSLSIEEYFYLLWAPVVLRCSRKWIVVIGSSVCIIEILLRWAFNDDTAYYDLFLHSDTLLYGAGLALLLEHWKRFTRPSWANRLFGGAVGLSILGLSVILLSIRPVMHREIRSSPLFLAFGLPLISTGAAGIIGLLVLQAGGDWWLARLLRTRPFQFVGTISYTMYLVHVLIMVLLVQGAKHLHLGTEPYLRRC